SCAAISYTEKVRGISFGGTAKTRFWVNLPSDLDSEDWAKY
ncbi:hypothetical protein HKBW3S42_01444, partial [Candidatus Hakubella thermalkaliphila]